MKVMVTGAKGMLGQEVLRTLHQQGIEGVGIDRADADITDAAAVLSAVERVQPDAIVHCAAYTAVDRAESETRLCMDVNAMGTLHVARAAQKVGAKMLYVSTDYVFDGSGDAPHEAWERPLPVNVYGLSKLQGEEAVRGIMSRYFILRTSWLFGEGGNFVRTMKRLGKTNAEVRVVMDQVGAPTYAADLAKLIVQMIGTEKYGVYHAANEGSCSFAELATATMMATGSRCRVIPVTTKEYGSAAKRPGNSRLSKKSLDEAGFMRLPIWEDALSRYLTEMEGKDE